MNPFNQYIDIYPDRLPNEVRLIAQIVGNTAGFCPDNLTFATGFAPAGEKETLVVVSNFADTLGNDPRNLTFDLIERMVEILAPHEQIRVERLNCAIKQQGGSETAMRIGSRSDVEASIVIWGVYVSPPEPEIHIYFDIVKQQQTYLGAGFDRNFGPQLIQPDMFDFKASLGEQAGEVVAFAAGLVLFNADEHLAAEPLFTTAIAVADQPLAEGLSRALHTYLGANYLYLGQVLDAKDELVNALLAGMPENAAEDNIYRKLLNLIGTVYSALGEQEHALDFLNRALLLNREIGDKVGETTVLHNIGGVYYALGNQEQALDFLNQALLLQREVGNRIGEANILENLGEVHIALSDYKQALDFLDQALLLQREVGDKAGVATALNNMGVVYSGLDDKKRALDFYNQALIIVQELGDTTMEAISLGNVGGIYNNIDDQQSALDFYKRALSLQRVMNDKAGESTTLYRIGRIYDDLDDKQQALGYYNRALSLQRVLDDHLGESNTRFSIGFIYIRLGEFAKAEAQLEIVVALDKEFGHPDLEIDKAVLERLRTLRTTQKED